MPFTHLLAKKTETPDEPDVSQTLVGHATAVINATQVIQEFISPTVLQMITPEIDSDCWQTALFCAAWLHDLGKANDHFQKMLRTNDFRQGIRHESLGLVVLIDLLDSWLSPLWSRYPSFVKAAVFFAIGGHHLKFPDQEQRGHTEVVFLGEHPQLHELLKLGCERCKLGVPPGLVDQPFSLLAFAGIAQKLSALRRHLDFDSSPKEKVFIASLKATLMSADLAGSALPPKGIPLEEWVRERLKITLNQQQIEKIAHQKLGGKSARPFQRQVQEATGKTILIEAGCGSGKTVAAYLWAARRASARRLFFCYPTTVTASEGFSGYLREPEFDALLVHSRASLDYSLLDNMPPYSKTAAELRSLRLEAIDTWPIPAVVCTAHTVLGILQNVRRALYAWPSLIRSLFVFDEIHSFSPLLFQHLLRFLEVFHNIPVLLMTATLPPERKEALRLICQKRGGLTVIQGPRQREEALRYVLRRADETDAWETVEAVLSTRGKVLWVANTVDRAIKLAQRGFDLGLPVQPFHSRYRYKDRLVRQRTVIDGFSRRHEPMMAITTQVAEMSLDISADLLVTEYAPIASLIQRLGRLNRFVDEPPEVKQGLFLKPENAAPYAAKEASEKFWEPVEAWLDRAATGLPQSQKDLATAFWEEEQYSYDPAKTSLICDWLDDPWSSLSNRHSLMEPSYTIEVVREEDAAEVPLAAVALPMPFPPNKAWHKWQIRGRYLIAPRGVIAYDPFWGGKYAHEKSHFEII